MRSTLAKCLLSLGLIGAPAFADNEVKPLSGPVLEHPTLRSLGAYWIVQGDDNRNATVELSYRKAGDTEWRKGMNFMRVMKGHHDPMQHPDTTKKAKPPESAQKSTLNIPEDGWLFAGSALMLDPGTNYELTVTLRDPDENSVTEYNLKARTATEPVEPAGQTVIHVTPGGGGGSGSKDDPYKGLDAATQAAKPGTTLLVGPGIYKGAVQIHKSGAEGKPIIIRGEQGAIIDCKGDSAEPPPSVGINIIGQKHLWLENLEIQNAKFAIVGHDTAHIVLRRCNIHDVDYGFTATRNTRGDMVGHFITDNVMKGPSTWPRSKGIEGARGIQVSGVGHVVAYNKVTNFGDAIDTFPSAKCEAIDFHNNDVSILTDDGLEMDYSHRNTRCFENRLTNVFQGITLQPTYGGPVYVFRNTMQNVQVEAFKLHNESSGVYLMHNTMLKPGDGWVVYTPVPMHQIISRNNLVIGTKGKWAINMQLPLVECDFDYDGFGGEFEGFLKWHQARYMTMDDAMKNAPVYKHPIKLDPKKTFVSGALPPNDATAQAVEPADLRLKPESEAVDAGVPIPGMNDGFAGKAPDLGAFEIGQPLPHYGPRQK